MKPIQKDIIIIGAGSAGLTLSSFFNTIGLDVLLVEKSDNHIGGDCLNFGCVPSKAIIDTATEIYHANQIHKTHKGGSLHISQDAIFKRLQRVTRTIKAHENASALSKKGLTVALGNASFVDNKTISVSDKQYKAKRIILATGSKPRMPDLPGLEKTEWHTNETIFKIKQIPKRLLIVGAGPIGIELGQAFQRLGSKVHILQRSGAILKKEEPELTQQLETILTSEGMTINHHVTSISFPSKKKAQIISKKGKKTIPFDNVLIATGRIPRLDALDLEKAGITVDDSGKLIVDDYLRTTNRRVYACGDVVGDYFFTHEAERQAQTIITNLLNPFKKKRMSSPPPRVTYSSPELASVGYTQEQLEARHESFTTITIPLSENDRHIIDEQTTGMVKAHISKGKLRGASILSPYAGELIQGLLIFFEKQYSLRTLLTTTYPYPTRARIIKRIAQNYYALTLTPFKRKVLQILYNIKLN